MIIRQVQLRQGNARMVAWLDVSRPVRAGNVVVGKDGQRWSVETVYSQVMDSANLNRNWKVGGLL